MEFHGVLGVLDGCVGGWVGGQGFMGEQGLKRRGNFMATKVECQLLKLCYR